MSNHFRLLIMSCAPGLAGLQGAKAGDIEIFGGYTLGKMKPENEANRATMSGWNASATAYLTSRFGVTADFAGYYGSAHAAIATTGGSAPAASAEAESIRQYSFMAGPQFRILRTRHLETSLRAVFGGAYGYLPAPAYNTFSQTTFAALVGSNVDIKLSRRVALRFSPGLYVTRFGTDQTQKNFRFSVGPVFQFGGES